MSTKPNNLSFVLIALAFTVCSAETWAQAIPPTSYLINVQLLPDEKEIRGSQTVVWRNQTSEATDELQFHLYLNAFKNNLTTFARESQFASFWPGPVPDSYWGFIEVPQAKTTAESKEAGLEIESSEFVHFSGGAPSDETVLRIRLTQPVLPGGSVGLEMDFRAKLPRGVARTGWTQDYYFAGQWFPKLGVFREGRWICPPYHALTEYYADFGNYDVKVTIPESFKIGASGPGGKRDNEDGTVTYRFVSNGIHDFAWVASPRFIERKQNFFAEGMDAAVEVMLLILPEHEALGDRYLSAAQQAMTRLVAWFGPYPYQTLTIVDPAFGSDTGGMEYPLLITGGADPHAPEALALEAVTVHEIAHQWWYGLVANNEFEEAWLDEGLASWSEVRILNDWYPTPRYLETYFGGVPVVYSSVLTPWESENRRSVRRFGGLAPVLSRSWNLPGPGSYQANSYAKPALALSTLENLVGTDRMLRAMKAFLEKFVFSHASAQDFELTLRESLGGDLQWFFDQTLRSSEQLDYAVVRALSDEIPPLEGISSSGVSEDADQGFLTEVLVERKGGAQFPVTIRLVFEDGESRDFDWDGQDGSRLIRIPTGQPLRAAIVDPERKLLLDVNPVNNSRLSENRSGSTHPAIWKWSSKWLFWVQNLLETFAFVG